MDIRSQEMLNEILAKEPEALSNSEIGFLKARRSYLKKIQLEEYKDILDPVQTSEVTETVKKKHGRRRKK